MNREDIIRMGIEAGLYSGNPRTPGTGNMIVRRLERFATLVAAAERDACAKVCEEHWEIDGTRTAKEFANAIRARGQS